jgi:bifunctional UDP-N-acetylglucosamine pyrophosphorylase/glucosamine-1-phosphate N-acetyltransferase
MKTAAVILAAGQGTRMRSSLPKILHPILGRPMITYALENARQLSDSKPVLVIGHGADAVRQAVGDGADFAIQAEQLGTAHALQQAHPVVDAQADLILVTAGDMPLLKLETLQRLVKEQAANPGPITMSTINAADPKGFGRVIRLPSGSVGAIVEEASATPEQLAVRELNVGAYCFSASWIWDALKRVAVSPKGEFYLTDTVALAVQEGLPVKAVCLDDPLETIGINTRVHLAEAEQAMRQRINSRWMLAGVTLTDPAGTVIEPGVEIGRDTVIYGGTSLLGSTRTGQGCEIGPNALLRDAALGEGCRVVYSVVEAASLADGESIGPFAHLNGNNPEGRNESNG